MVHQSILALHLLAAIFWIGGMATLHYCVRPAALAVLTPPQPVSLLHATLKRFLLLVGIAVVVLVLTGIHLYGLRGGPAARWGVQVMAIGGMAMALVYGHIRFALYKRLSAAVTNQAWTEAKAALEQIRTLVFVNLILGVLIVVAVKVGA